jgi:hypothetical protein
MKYDVQEVLAAVGAMLDHAGDAIGPSHRIA